MKKKEFKLLVATNPVLYKWMKENALWLKAKPEVIMYLTQQPDAIKLFRAGQSIDNEKIFKQAQQFMNQVVEERQLKKKDKRQGKGAAETPKKEKTKKGLFSGLRAMFNKPVVAAQASAQLPVLTPPGMRSPGRKGVHSAAPLPKPVQKPAFRIPKLKISRSKLMSTLNQTTEMLDVVAALMGKAGNLK